MHHLRRALIPVCLLLLPCSARSEVISFEVRQREPYAEGRSFGDVGPYEKIGGVVRYALDPKHPGNRRIVDLELAPRNADGRVEFEADFYLLAPKDPARGNG